MITEDLQFSLNTNSRTQELFNYNSGWNSYQHIEWTPEEYAIYQNKIQKLLSQPKSSKLGKRIYLGRLSSLPRHRIKEYFKSNGIEKTSKISYADSIIMNKEYIIDFNTNFDPNKRWGGFYEARKYSIKTEDELKLIFKYTDCKGDRYSEAINQFNNGKKASIIVEKENYYHINTVLNNFSYTTLYMKKLYREANVIELIEYLELLKKYPNIQVVYDEDLLKPLNKDGIKLDEDYLKTLNSMFESKNQDNINLALEMLSNVSIEDNSLTIALFLNKHYPLFSWGSGLTIKNNISFKSILKYLKSQKIDYEKDWRLFSTALYKIHKNNPESVLIIKDFVKQNLNTYLSEWNKDIEIKEVNLEFHN
jgi:hypothetical protein